MVHLSREAMVQKTEDLPLAKASALGPGSLKGVTPSKVVASTKEAAPTKGATSAKKTAFKTKEPAKANIITKKEHFVKKEPASSKKGQGSAGEQASRCTFCHCTCCLSTSFCDPCGIPSARA